MTRTDQSPPKLLRYKWLRTWSVVMGFAIVLTILVFFNLGFVNQFSRHTLEFLLSQLNALRRTQVEHPQVVIVLGFVLYVVVTGLSLPGAAPMSLAFGWLFGFWQGLVVVSFASTTGAVIAFLLSRHLLRQRIQNAFGDRLRRFNTALQEDGAYYLFTLRLIPAVPFFVINVVMGLTPIPTRTFWWVSQLGMLPATVVYVYAGTALPGLEELRNPNLTRILSPQLLLALLVLGVFPLLVKKICGRFLPKSSEK